MTLTRDPDTWPGGDAPPDDLTLVYTEATRIAMRNDQTTGEKKEYFVTLRQLETIMLSIKE